MRSITLGFRVRVSIAISLLMLGIGSAGLVWSAIREIEAGDSTEPTTLAVDADAEGNPLAGHSAERAPFDSRARAADDRSTEMVQKPVWVTAEPAAGSQLPILAYGRTDYDQTRLIQLSSRVGGVVWRVERRLGDFVRAGELVAIVESSEVGQAKAALLSSLATYHLQMDLLERLRTLDPNVVSVKQVDLAEARVRSVQIELFNAQQTLLNLGLLVKLEELLPLSEEEALAKLRLIGLPDNLAAQLDPTQTTANLLPLLAPGDGVIIGAEMVRGEVLTPGVPLATLADVRHMWLRLDVPASEASRLRMGQPVRFVPDDGSRVIESQICWISTEVDPRTRTVEVRANFLRPAPNQGPLASQAPLRAYTYGQGSISPRQHHTSVVVPTDAVFLDGASYWVLVAKADQQTEQRGVVLGRVEGETTEIQAGLEPGERVLVAGGATDSDRFRLAENLSAPLQSAPQ